ncbi:reverse transcriptase domain-containing protein [Tanacetum coccineum]
MSDMTACLNDLSYIPLNNEQNTPTRGDIGETSNDLTQDKCNKFAELYASANKELYPGCDYVTRLDFMAVCTEPGKMQHPVDGRAWKYFDTKYLDFAAETRNVRLGLVVDGFNPFGNLIKSVAGLSPQPSRAESTTEPSPQSSRRRAKEMSADVARGHGGDGGGDDRKGTRKPNLGGRSVGRQHTRQETQNLGLKAITDKSGPVPIRFEFGDRETRMPLGEHAAHWANYLGELIRELSLPHPSWRQVPPEEKAGVMARIGVSYFIMECVLTWNAIAGHLSMRPSSSIYKRSTMARMLLLRKSIGFLTRTGLTTWSASDNHVPRTFLRSIEMHRLRFGMTPRIVPGLPNINKTGQKARSSATREYPSLIYTFFLTHTINGVFLNPEDKVLYDELLRLQGLGSKTETGVPYIEDEIIAIVRGGKQRGHIPGVGRFLPGQRMVIPPSPPCKHSSDVAKLKKREKLESKPEIGGGSRSGGCGDDEQGYDEDDGEDEEDEDDS